MNQKKSLGLFAKNCFSVGKHSKHRVSLSLSLLFTTYYQTVHTYLSLHLSNNPSLFIYLSL